MISWKVVRKILYQVRILLRPSNVYHVQHLELHGQVYTGMTHCPLQHSSPSPLPSTVLVLPRLHNHLQEMLVLILLHDRLRETLRNEKEGYLFLK